MFAIKLLFSGETTYQKKDKLFFETFRYSSAWFRQHAPMCSSIPEWSSVASVKERIKSKLRTADENRLLSEGGTTRRNPAIQIPGAGDLRFFRPLR